MNTESVFLIDQVGETLVVTPTRDLRELDFDRIQDGAQHVFDTLGRGNAKNVIVDLRNTDYYGSTALGFFVKLWKRVKTDGGQMVFCGVSETEQEILELTRLSELWPQRRTREEALADLQGGLLKD